MNFKDWCIHEFGILDFSEGTIPVCVFIPALSNSDLLDSHEIYSLGGQVINTPFLHGMIMPSETFQKLTRTLRNYYFDHYSFDHNSCSQWINLYFARLGVNLEQEGEYNEPSNIQITFQSEKAHNNFLTRFNSFNPEPGFTVLSQKQSLQFPAFFIPYLRQLYYQSPNAEINNPEMVPLIQQHIRSMKSLTKLLEKRHLRSSLDYANILSKDFNNTRRKGANPYDYQAASAYAISLKVFAELYRDCLSANEYENCNYAASLLATYDKKGCLKQSLKTDAKFVQTIVDLFYSSTQIDVQGDFVLDNLPQTQGELIISLINQNTINMLYGNPKQTLGKNACFRMLRFLPDKEMLSETDELIFQGGNSSAHSSIYRIIKVGILADGNRAEYHDKPLFYKYYKVEDNLGMGCQDMDPATKTCMGTYITQLIPFTNQHGQLVPCDINPYRQPNEYQHAMEFTLCELISVERQLLLYRNPAFQLDYDLRFGQTEEAKEWFRLNEMKNTLSGKPHAYPVLYFTRNALNSSRHCLRIVQNQKNLMQEGDSCPIFSLKSLVSGIIGIELTSLHNNFMQLNNADTHLSNLVERINSLQ